MTWQKTERMAGGQVSAGLWVGLLAPFALVACSTPQRMSAAELASIGLQDGTRYWEAQQKLAQRGYRCYVTGAAREHFDCTLTTGYFPSCVLRVTFAVDEQNRVSRLTVSEPACIGTP